MMGCPLVTFQKTRGDQTNYRMAAGAPLLSNNCSSSIKSPLGNTEQSAHKDAFMRLKNDVSLRNSRGDISGIWYFHVVLSAFVLVWTLFRETEAVQSSPPSPPAD